MSGVEQKSSVRPLEQAPVVSARYEVTRASSVVRIVATWRWDR